ncbi:MAG: Hpt domain-containing protein [Phycisphaeraceae bacterium]|nr:Hpt domain-containing protein [Phycisphaeraceae bacterium]
MTHSFQGQPKPSDPIRSQYADDPEMRELVSLFVTEIPERMERMLDAFRHQQWENVHRIAHQLKGSSAGYGFPVVGDAAAKVEDLLRTGPVLDEERLTALADSIKNLAVLCQSVRA